MPETLHSHGKDYKAVRCPRCRVLICPATAMALHKAMHKLKDLRAQHDIDGARVAFKQMRDNWW